MDDENSTLPKGVFRSLRHVNGKWVAIVAGVVVEEANLGIFYNICRALLARFGIFF